MNIHHLYVIYLSIMFLSIYNQLSINLSYIYLSIIYHLCLSIIYSSIIYLYLSPICRLPILSFIDTHLSLHLPTWKNPT